MNNQAINQYKSRHEQVLFDIVSNANIPAQKLKEAILYSLFPGGKRLRPMLVYLAGELLDVNIQALDIMASAIELIHSFSLIHDDLPAMDNDDYRRDKLSCHRAFDEPTAILAGDAILTLAIDILLTKLPQYISPIKTLEIAHELLFSCGASGMVSGQSLDMSELINPNISHQTLTNIHLLKTGKLINACIKMPSIASDAPNIAQESLITFASHLGLLFQMQDDYLDKYNTDNVLGKCRSSDSENQKVTFANLYSQTDLKNLIREHISKAQNALLMFGDKAKNLNEILIYLDNRV